MGGDEAEKQQNSDKEHGGIGMGMVLERREERREKIAREFVPLDRLDHEDGGLRGFANGLSRKETGGGGGGVADSRASESSGSGGGSSGGNNNGGAAVAGATGEGEGGVDKTDGTGSGDGSGEQLGSNGKGKKEAVQTQLDGDDIPLLMPLKGLFKSKDLDEEIKEEEEEERKKGERGAERKRQVARREFRSDDWSHLGETRPGLSSSESGAGGGGGANTTGVAGTAAGDGVTRDSTETSHSASAASNGASQATAGTTASSSATKEGEHGTHMPSVTKTNETSGEKGGDVGQLVGRILDRLDDMEDEGGKFNKTLEKQEAVLETVARVGKHHVLEEVKEREQREEQEDRQVLEEAEREEAQEKMKQLEQVALAMAAAEAEKKAKKKGVAAVAAVVSQGVKASEVSLFDLVFGRDSSGKQPPPVSPSPSLRTKNLTRLAAAKKRFAERAGRGAREKERSERVDEGENDVPRLIDSQDNEYVISSPGKGSKMQLQEDFMLISDVVKVIVAAALGGLACGLVGQPIILGYIVAGMIIGPGGFGLIHELVQVETLAQFGVVFLLFAIGVEFSLARMQGVHAVALAGGIIQIGLSMVLGGIASSNTPQGLFIGGFLSMSSTAVVLKCLMDINSMGTEHGQIMLGTLISQDCALGLLLAIMPALAARPASASAILLALLRELLILLAFALIAWLLARFFVPRFLPLLLRLARGSFNSEIYHLGVVAVCLCVALLSEGLGLSLEVGAFVAGLMLSGNSYSERTLHQVEPIRNLFAALFLASIGMVMHPLFLWQHIDILLIAVAVVFVSKACLVGFVVRAFGYSTGTAASVGVALAQIGEFSFVLLSRAQTLKLVGHKLYLLLMGTTALSLVLTPFTFLFVPRLALLFPSTRSRPRAKASASPAPAAAQEKVKSGYGIKSAAVNGVGGEDGGGGGGGGGGLLGVLSGSGGGGSGGGGGGGNPGGGSGDGYHHHASPLTGISPRDAAAADSGDSSAVVSGGVLSYLLRQVQPRTRNAAKAAGTSGGGGAAAAAAAAAAAGAAGGTAAAAAAASNKSDESYKGIERGWEGCGGRGDGWGDGGDWGREVTAGGEAGGAALGATAGAAAGAAMGATGGRNGGWGSARGL
ncbi:unnamed protein product [Closterium sp. NIES-65]|nr:unnamed protein product [Closterium sp. NIES-65]